MMGRRMHPLVLACLLLALGFIALLKSLLAILITALGMSLLLTTLQPTDVTGTIATRSLVAQQRLLGADGGPLVGAGVSIAVIDSGVDPAHPSFQLPNGSSKVVRSLTSRGCDDFSTTDSSCVQDVAPPVDSDGTTGGHGSFVAGIAAGNRLTLPDGTRVGGAAPGARLVVIAKSTWLHALNAMNWVLHNHAAPCGTAVSASICPPIRVINNSWQSSSDPIIIDLQDQLAASGVVTVWSNGNQGGNGSTDKSNPAGEDPTPGILSVAGYDDWELGTTDGRVMPESSRGAASRPPTWPKISAPGVQIVSSCRPAHTICVKSGTGSHNGPGRNDRGTFNTMSGTSCSAGEISGIVAQLFQAKPSATPGEIEDALKSTAHKYDDGAAYQPLGRYTSSFDKGTGLADAYAAALRLGARARR